MLLTPPAVARAHVVTTGRPSLLGRIDTVWRAPLAALALLTAATHVPVTPDHLHEALYIGLLFIALEVASVALAVALLLRPTRAALMGTAVVGGLAVLALVVSRTVGLPLIGDDIGNWTEPLAVVSLVVEVLMTAGAVIALARPAMVRLAPRAGVVASLVVLVIGGIATGVATAVEYAPSPSHASDSMHGMDMGLGADTASSI